MKRKIKFLAFCSVLFWASSLFAQDGKIISSSEIAIPDSVKQFRIKRIPAFVKIFDSTKVSKLIYLSDGLKVEGFIAEPKQTGKYPCIIFCRGGADTLGMIDFYTMTFLSEIASKGYVIIASQYRGKPTSEGIDEFGGKEVNDVINCIPVLAQWHQADTAKIGMYGVSRGGMMIYRALQTLQNIKAVVINSGVVDLFDTFKRTDSTEWENFYKDKITGYPINKMTHLQVRSALYWPEKISNKTALFIMHGSTDSQVDAAGVISFIQRIYTLKKPVKFVLYEGGVHALQNIKNYKLPVWDWFDRFLKNNESLPNLNIKR